MDEYVFVDNNGYEVSGPPLASMEDCEDDQYYYNEDDEFYINEDGDVQSYYEDDEVHSGYNGEVFVGRYGDHCQGENDEMRYHDEDQEMGYYDIEDEMFY